MKIICKSQSMLELIKSCVNGCVPVFHCCFLFQKTGLYQLKMFSWCEWGINCTFYRSYINYFLFSLYSVWLFIRIHSFSIVHSDVFTSLGFYSIWKYFYRMLVFETLWNIFRAFFNERKVGDGYVWNYEMREKFRSEGNWNNEVCFEHLIGKCQTGR